MIDDVIDPRETRETICRALEMAEGKQIERPWKRQRGGARMSLEDPVVITCSISGAIANREQCPAIPYTPEEYAAEARRIVDEGGAMIHIHARKPDGTPSYEIEDFQAITDAIRAEVGRRRDHQLLDRHDRRAASPSGSTTCAPAAPRWRR